MSSNLPFVSKFAIHNYMRAEEGIIDAAQNNFQVWYIDFGLHKETPNNWDKNRITQLLKSIERYKVTPILHSNFKAPLAYNDKILRLEGIEYVKKEIDLAHKLCAPLIIHGGDVSAKSLTMVTKENAIKSYLCSLLILQAYANKLNVDLYLENLCNNINDKACHYVFSETEEFQYILEEIDLPLFLDIGHANLCGGNPIDIFKQFNKRIIGMCFSNNDGIKDQHMGIEDGTINYKELMKCIIYTKWNGLIAFETINKIAEQNISKVVEIYKEVMK